MTDTDTGARYKVQLWLTLEELELLERVKAATTGTRKGAIMQGLEELDRQKEKAR